MSVRYVVVAFMAHNNAEFDLVVGIYEDKATADEVAKEHNHAVVYSVPYYKEGQ